MGQTYDVICRRRTVRRFLQMPVTENELVRFVNAARLAPSAGNVQPCEYIVVNHPLLCTAIFPHLKWARAIEPDGTPGPGERPTAYILVLIDLHKRKKGGEVDSAAAIQNILLAAWESGVGSCWIQSVDRKKVKKLFRIPHHVKLDSVVALGYPNEQPQAEDMMHSFRYYKDGKGTLHVPKRRLDTICFINEYVFSQKG